MDVQAFIDQCMESLRAQTEAHSVAWHLGREEQWVVDQEQGLIRLSFGDGRLVEAPVQIVGTLNMEDSTFLWAWDHPSAPLELQRHAALARRFGQEHQIPEYVAPKVACSELQAWSFIAVAVRQAEANGGYRVNAGGSWVYVTFGRVRLGRVHGKDRGRGVEIGDKESQSQ